MNASRSMQHPTLRFGDRVVSQYTRRFSLSAVEESRSSSPKGASNASTPPWLFEVAESREFMQNVLRVFVLVLARLLARIQFPLTDYLRQVEPFVLPLGHFLPDASTATAADDHANRIAEDVARRAICPQSSCGATALLILTTTGALSCACCGGLLSPRAPPFACTACGTAVCHKCGFFALLGLAARHEDLASAAGAPSIAWQMASGEELGDSDRDVSPIRPPAHESSGHGPDSDVSLPLPPGPRSSTDSANVLSLATVADSAAHPTRGDDVASAAAGGQEEQATLLPPRALAGYVADTRPPQSLSDAGSTVSVVSASQRTHFDVVSDGGMMMASEQPTRGEYMGLAAGEVSLSASPRATSPALDGDSLLRNATTLTPCAPAADSGGSAGANPRELVDTQGMRSENEAGDVDVHPERFTRPADGAVLSEGDTESVPRHLGAPASILDGKHSGMRASPVAVSAMTLTSSGGSRGRPRRGSGRRTPVISTAPLPITSRADRSQMSLPPLAQAEPSPPPRPVRSSPLVPTDQEYLEQAWSPGERARVEKTFEAVAGAGRLPLRARAERTALAFASPCPRPPVPEEDLEPGSQAAARRAVSIRLELLDNLHAADVSGARESADEPPPIGASSDPSCAHPYHHNSTGDFSRLFEDARSVGMQDLRQRGEVVNSSRLTAQADHAPPGTSPQSTTHIPQTDVFSAEALWDIVTQTNESSVPSAEDQGLFGVDRRGLVVPRSTQPYTALETSLRQQRARRRAERFEDRTRCMALSELCAADQAIVAAVRCEDPILLVRRVRHRTAPCAARWELAHIFGRSLVAPPAGLDAFDVVAVRPRAMAACGAAATRFPVPNTFGPVADSFAPMAVPPAVRVDPLAVGSHSRGRLPSPRSDPREPTTWPAAPGPDVRSARDGRYTSSSSWASLRPSLVDPPPRTCDGVRTALHPHARRVGRISAVSDRALANHSGGWGDEGGMRGCTRTGPLSSGGTLADWDTRADGFGVQSMASPFPSKVTVGVSKGPAETQSGAVAEPMVCDDGPAVLWGVPSRYRAHDAATLMNHSVLAQGPDTCLPAEQRPLHVSPHAAPWKGTTPRPLVDALEVPAEVSERPVPWLRRELSAPLHLEVDPCATRSLLRRLDAGFVVPVVPVGDSTRGTRRLERRALEATSPAAAVVAAIRRAAARSTPTFERDDRSRLHTTSSRGCGVDVDVPETTSDASADSVSDHTTSSDDDVAPEDTTDGLLPQPVLDGVVRQFLAHPTGRVLKHRLDTYERPVLNHHHPLAVPLDADGRSCSLLGTIHHLPVDVLRTRVLLAVSIFFARAGWLDEVCDNALAAWFDEAYAAFPVLLHLLPHEALGVDHASTWRNRHLLHTMTGVDGCLTPEPVRQMIAQALRDPIQSARLHPDVITALGNTDTPLPEPKDPPAAPHPALVARVVHLIGVDPYVKPRPVDVAAAAAVAQELVCICGRELRVAPAGRADALFAWECGACHRAMSRGVPAISCGGQCIWLLCAACVMRDIYYRANVPQPGNVTSSPAPPKPAHRPVSSSPAVAPASAAPPGRPRSASMRSTSRASDARTVRPSPHRPRPAAGRRTPPLTDHLGLSRDLSDIQHMPGDSVEPPARHATHLAPPTGPGRSSVDSGVSRSRASSPRGALQSFAARSLRSHGDITTDALR
eukprot:TRINITY_DN9771_c0_g1_i1.p1 TRINITY_DN9771_c0_g1~~TRINITY_DN9771_c0_g1_i1.p1  ORF type:complete len:1667 (-),score=75.07 TRINITY_DN9771_c0_g1_i1:80-5080(-)